jgi:hypothetical protein
MFTRRLLIAALVSSLLYTPLARAQGNSWDKVRYNGGTVATKTDPDDWKNTLTVTSDAITLKLKDGQTVVIDPAKVTGLSYGQEAHRRVGTMVALGIIVAPLALFGLFHKTKKHFIGMDYETANGKKAGILLQGHKDNFRAVLLALSSATGQPISVDPKDRKEVPATVAVTEVSAPADDKAKADAKPAPTGVIKLESTPAGAEVWVDGKFIGNAPAQLKLAPGKHTIKVTAPGHQDWTRDLEVMTDSEVSLRANLDATSTEVKP